MKTFLIGLDTHLTSGGALFEFEKRLPDGKYRFAHCDTGEPLVFGSRNDLTQALASGKVSKFSEEQKKPVPFLEKMTLPVGPRDFGSYSGKKREDALYRHGYVVPFIAGAGMPLPRKARALLEIPEEVALKDPTDEQKKEAEAKAKRRRMESNRTQRELIAKHAQRIGDKTPPSVNAVRGWVRSYLEGGSNLEVLVSRCTGRIAGLQAEAEAMIEKVIQEVYLTLERPTKMKAYQALIAMIAEENGERVKRKQEPLKTPGKRTLDRRIDAVPAYVRVLRRHGPDEARRRFRATTREKPYVTRILEAVEMDHTQLDVIVYDDELQLPLGRPWITAARDKLTGMCVGFYVTLTKPNVAAVFACLAHIADSKDYVDDRYPFVNGFWDCSGLPELLVLDNGMEFHAKDLREALAQLNIDVSYHARRSPWIKGLIERFFKDLGEDLIQMIPGTTFGNSKKRGDYKSVKRARLRFSTLIALLHKWVIDVHSQGTSDLFYKPRIQAWREAAKAHEPFLPCDYEELRRILSERESRKLSHKGIVLHRLAYQSPELNRVREVLGVSEKDTVDVTVLFDRRNLGSVHVVVPKTGETIKVPCTHSRYAEGVTLEMHQIISRRARKQFKSAESELSLSVAQLEIMRAIREEMREQRLALRTRLASRTGIHSEATNANTRQTVAKLIAKEGVVIPVANAAGELRASTPFASEMLDAEEVA